MSRMPRLQYFIKRLLLVIPTFIGITFVVFAITQFVPGGPVEQKIMQMRGLGRGEAGGGGRKDWQYRPRAGRGYSKTLWIRQAAASAILDMACERPSGIDGRIL